MVAFPASYDAMWVQWYLHRFVGDDPFRRRAIDIKTMAMVAMGAGYRATAKSSLPKHWRPPAKHTHVAVEDAIEQGELLMNIVRELNVQRGEIVTPRESEAGKETPSRSAPITRTGAPMLVAVERRGQNRVFPLGRVGRSGFGPSAEPEPAHPGACAQPLCIQPVLAAPQRYRRVRRLGGTVQCLGASIRASLAGAEYRRGPADRRTP